MISLNVNSLDHTCIKLFTTISPNFCRRFEKVKELRSYELWSIMVIVTKFKSLSMPAGSEKKVKKETKERTKKSANKKLVS